jgi:hypothetical protein
MPFSSHPASSNIEQVQKILLGVSSPEKRIPKYCNGVIFGKLSDGGFILTFVAKEKLDSEKDGKEESIVIERIYIDANHAKQIADTLSKLTND